MRLPSHRSIKVARWPQGPPVPVMRKIAFRRRRRDPPTRLEAPDHMLPVDQDADSKSDPNQRRS